MNVDEENIEFKIELWNKWAKENYKSFTDLIDDATIAVSITGCNEQIILLKKGNNGLKVSSKAIKNYNEIENYADLLFIMDKKNVLKIFNDNSSSKFIDLLCSGKIEVHELISKLELIEKGYNLFLYGLGLRLEGICSCD